MNIQITQRHMDILRSQIKGTASIDVRTPELRQLDQPGDWISYYALVSTAFSEAVGIRFDKNSTRQEVIKFVGDARAQSETNADWIHPEAAEYLILEAVFGKPNVKLERKIRFVTELSLLQPLLGSVLRDMAELDRFADKVWNRSHRTLGAAKVTGAEE